MSTSTLRLESLEYDENNNSQEYGSFNNGSNSIHTDWSVSSDGSSLLHKSTGVHITQEGTKGLDSEYGLGDVYVSLKDFDVNPTPLGHGRSSVVYNAIHKQSGKVVAIKDIYVGDLIHQTQLSAEIHSWRLTSYCPLLVQFLGAFIKPNKNVVCLVMEYMDFGTLSDILYKNINKPNTNFIGIDEKYLKFIVMQIVDGLVYLHQNNRIHRDVKLNNILINQDGAVKISDFGISKLIDKNTAKGSNKNISTFVGTQIYMSPERLQGKSYSFSSDIWGLGICLFEMAVGIHPFKSLSLFDMVYILCEDDSSDDSSNSNKHFLDKITKKYPLPDSLANNYDFYSFLKCCLEIDPDKRSTALELQKSNWITQGTCNRLEFLDWLINIQKPNGNL
ncbi:kinase NPK2 [Cryptosporidium bovis]|uniref:kinase NPK2 n=1 Tax=Cryptosporidium bovis TaxID=310047 RepID=UPI003519E5BA|nr:kinase NPK2 [Cryptosporidium bovis]